MTVKLKVLLLNTQMEAAGAQKAMLELAKKLQEHGHEVQVVTMYDKADYVALFRRQYGVPILDLHMKVNSGNQISNVGNALRGLWNLYRLMRRERYDVVQTFSHYSNIMGPILAWLAGIRVRVSSQRMSLRSASQWLIWLDKTVANSFLIQQMTSVAEATRRFCIQTEGIRPDKVITIHNGIDIERYANATNKAALRRELGLSPSVFTVVTIARLHHQKGHRYLIEALPTVLQKHHQLQFLFVGEGNLRRELETQVQQLGLTENVQFLGTRQDIPDILAVADLKVLPSLWEGLPNCVLEAMAACVPVIATEVDGTVELMTDGETGVLVPPADSSALAQAICYMIECESIRNALSTTAFNFIEKNFSQEAMAEAYMSLYARLLSTPREIHAKSAS